MKVGILGPGALGCLFGACLARAGNEVWFLDRRPERAQRLAQDGVAVSYPDSSWEGPWRVAVRATTRPEAVGVVDLLLVTVKCYDTAAAAADYAPAVGPAATVLTLQNGLGNAEIIMETLGVGRVMTGVTTQGATLKGLGQVIHAGAGDTVVGWYQGRGATAESGRQAQGAVQGADEDAVQGADEDAVQGAAPGAGAQGPTPVEIAALLADAGVPCQAVADVTPHLWGKLVINCAINAVSALFGVPNGRLLEIPTAAGLMARAARETAAVAAAAGISLPFADPVAAAAGVACRTANNRSSMLQDLEAGRPTEIEFLNGAVVREGQRWGVPTPVNEELTRHVRDQAQRRSAR